MPAADAAATATIAAEEAMLQEAAESKREREISLQRLHANELVRIKEMTTMQVEEAREMALSEVEAHQNLLAMELKDIRAQKESIILGAKKSMETIETERVEAAKAVKERSATKLREELNILASKAAAERAVAENIAAAKAMQIEREKEGALLLRATTKAKAKLVADRLAADHEVGVLLDLPISMRHVNIRNHVVPVDFPVIESIFNPNVHDNLHPCHPQ